MSHSKKNGHMFIRASELSSRNKIQIEHKLGVSLSFNHCAFSLQPIRGEAVTTRDGGYMFDILNIMPWIRKHKIHPITGNPLDFKDIIRLKIAINDEGKPYCPVSRKIFTDQSHIIAIATSGNVYAFSAIENLNLKEGEVMHDSMDHTEFKKEDIITLQDPLHPREIKTMQHEIEQKDKKRKSQDESVLERASEKINLNSATMKVLEEMEKRKKKKIESGKEEVALTSSSLRSEEQSFGVLSSDTKSSSLTSSVMNVRTKSHETEKATEQYWKQKLEQYERIRKEFKSKKSFVSLHTNLGDLNLELYPYLCPQTCDNFLTLCAKGYYNGVKFHRLIKGFMIQGGDPTGTGKGGKSIWGSEFKDEISPKLHHDSIGTLSMANKGPNTNSSQFFITFKETPHLDNKHTVFGKVVGGLKLLQKIENIPVDEEDRPLEDVLIENVSIFYNPFTEDEQKQKEKEQRTQVVSNEDKDKFGNWFSNPSGVEKTGQSKVGKYLNLKSSSNSSSILPSSIIPIRKESDSNTSGQFNFNNW